MAFGKRPCIKRLLSPGRNSDITISTSLLEPTIYINTRHPYAPSVLRGRVVLDISKEVRIRDVAIRFRGVIRTRKIGRRSDEEFIVQRTWPVLGVGSRDFNGSLSPYGRRHHHEEERRRPSADSVFSVIRSEEEEEENQFNGRKQRTKLMPGRYVYEFELTLDQTLPETFNIGGCQLKYKLQAIVHRLGVLNRDISQSQEVAVLRCPEEMYLHDMEHISLARTWNNQIPYQVDIAGKGAPIGGDIPVSIKLSCSNITSIVAQVYLSQKIKYPGIKGKEAQLRRKLLLEGKCNDLSTVKFGDVTPYLHLETQGEEVTVEANVPFPEEHTRFITMHPDVEYEKLRVTHSLLFIIDVTRPPGDSSPHRPTLCRLTAETAFCIRSPHTRMYNMFVPQYSADDLPTIYNSFRNSRALDLSEQCSDDDDDNDAATVVAPAPGLTPCSTQFSFLPPLYHDLDLSAVDRFEPPPAYESILWNAPPVEQTAVVSS